MTKQNIIKLLRSGNFTIIYWDKEEPTLYKGKWDYNKEFDRDEYETMNQSIVDFEGWEVGYTNPIVKLLVTALKGKVDSI